jgi:hypothetical protein
MSEKYELGVSAAMRAVEIRVRTLGGFGEDDYGVDLMNHASGRADRCATRERPRESRTG